VDPAGPDEALALVLPAALELTTAAAGDPGLYWQTMRRVVGESLDGADPGRAVAQLLFGLSALNSILLDDLAATTGRDRAAILADLHRRYLSH